MAASALRPIETDDDADAAGRTGTGFSGGQGRGTAPDGSGKLATEAVA